MCYQRAFLKSTNKIWPSILHSSQPKMISDINLVQLLMVLPSKKLFCLTLISVLRSGHNLLVMQVDKSLYLVFSNEMGRHFLIEFIDFPILGKHVIVPSSSEVDR